MNPAPARRRSTLDAIDLVVNCVKGVSEETRWRGTRNYCLMATPNIKNAFNPVRWDYIKKAFSCMDVSRYLRRMIASYFTVRASSTTLRSAPKSTASQKGFLKSALILRSNSYSTDSLVITVMVPYISVLGSILWNELYDELLKLGLLTGQRLGVFADVVAKVVVAKYLEEITYIFLTKIRRFCR